MNSVRIFSVQIAHRRGVQLRSITLEFIRMKVNSTVATLYHRGCTGRIGRTSHRTTTRSACERKPDQGCAATRRARRQRAGSVPERTGSAGKRRHVEGRAASRTSADPGTDREGLPAGRRRSDDRRCPVRDPASALTQQVASLEATAAHSYGQLFYLSIYFLCSHVKMASMIITHYGREHFKLQVGDLTIAVNPVSKDGSGKTARYGADVCLITTNHPDYNGAEQVQYNGKAPFVIRGAGEYEVQNVFIKGFSTEVELKDGKEKKKYQNTSYVLVLDGIRITFLGALHEMLRPEHKEIIDETDVLFLPVGGDDTTLNPYDAHKLSVSLEPKLIIPMDYNEQTLPIFLKEAGAEKVEPLEKLTIKKKDIEGKLGEVVLFHEM